MQTVYIYMYIRVPLKNNADKYISLPANRNYITEKIHKTLQNKIKYSKKLMETDKR